MFTFIQEADKPLFFYWLLFIVVVTILSVYYKEKYKWYSYLERRTAMRNEPINKTLHLIGLIILISWIPLVWLFVYLAVFLQEIIIFVSQNIILISILLIAITGLLIYLKITKIPWKKYITYKNILMGDSSESTKLMHTLYEIDITNIDSISFTINNWWQFIVKTENIKRLTLYIVQKMGKTIFNPEELRKIYDYVIAHIDSSIDTTSYNLIVGKMNEFIREGWTVAINRV